MNRKHAGVDSALRGDRGREGVHHPFLDRTNVIQPNFFVRHCLHHFFKVLILIILLQFEPRHVIYNGLEYSNIFKYFDF